MNKNNLVSRTSAAALCAAALLFLVGCKKEAAQSSEPAKPRATNESRSTAERTRAAIGLWRRQAVALAIQLVTLIAAVLLEAMGL